MTWKVEVDTTRCMGSGLCVATSPTHFAMNGMTATATTPNPSPSDDILDAGESCPAMAILVTENGRDLLS